MPDRYSDFERYLTAKVSVDDRALHPRVWSTFAARLPRTGRVQIVEAGAGVGTMITRLLEAGLPPEADYHAVEAETARADGARRYLSRWSEKNGWSFEANTQGFYLVRADQRVQVHWHSKEVVPFIENGLVDGADVLLAHAFLDLVDLPRTLPPMLDLLKPQGVYCFTLTFDGLTAFLPVTDPPFEAELLCAYHRTMDQRVVNGQPSGHSQSGRRLLELLPRLGAKVLEAGPSDWLVRPIAGRYPADEAYFLHFIVETVHAAVLSEDRLDAVRLEAWAAARHEQIDHAQLTFLAHQWDVVGTR
ncbi:MAG TPA: hypothetical protein VFI11_10005 [Anaerolineales bacterium]|nr:hypothetical protein [Anaerolineales bacterium]